MKITFIRPNMGRKKASDALQPLAVAVLDGLTPAGFQTAFYDDRIEAVPPVLDTDLVAISVETFTAKRAYALADRYRVQGIPVVMGGYHPTFMPEEAKAHADAIMIGEAEDTWPDLLRDFQRHELKPFYTSSHTHGLESVNFNKRLFQNKRYAPVYPIQYSRGCRFACDFCSISAFYGSTLRQRPIADVVAEIEALGKRNIFIVDDNFYIDKEKTKAFLKALIPLGIRWSTQVSIDIAEDHELLDLMEKSGCMGVLIGFESLDARNLKQMGKAANLMNRSYSEAIKRIKARGIMLYGTFVFGYDYDTPDAFKISTEFSIENKLMLANFNPLMPMPGTKLYKRLVAENRMIHDKWWLDPHFKYGDAMFRPAGMTAEELTRGCKEARYAFNTFGSIGKRALDFEANCKSPSQLGLYLLANVISRNEIYKKQGASLGTESTDDMTPVSRKDFP